MIKLKIIILSSTIIYLTGCVADIEEGYLVPGIENPQILLNGNWELNTNPDKSLISDTQDRGDWYDIQVPGEVMMQGYAIRHDNPFIYRRKIMIPGDYAGKNVKLRFEGVYSYCRVWIDDTFVRDHFGGFTSWECNITPYVSAGKECWLFVEVTDKADEISYASGYAKHPIGGILRNVWLTASPQTYPEQVFISTDLDDEYQNAALQIQGILKGNSENAELVFQLFDRSGARVVLPENKLSLSGQSSFDIEFPVERPEKWDSEHPNLYRLSIEYLQEGELIWKKDYRVGFREVQVSGRKLLVNGETVKLRGACRHDIHPTLGRVSTPYYDSLDVQLALASNMNYIRTSHYPPTEYFLEQCDTYGLYVEDETAVCFVGSHRTDEYLPGDSQSDSTFTERYLSQLEEMVSNHRNHPSVIIWSVGNENQFGFNFQLSYDWVRKNDPTRPVMFSYPGLVPEGHEVYDITSMHYPSHTGDLNQYEIDMVEFKTDIEKPIINDEWAHVACYAKELVKEDPNIRDFWGISLDSMWHNTYESEGSTGGAIWGMIDEVFMLPDTLPGFNEWWGIIREGTNPQPYEGPAVGYGEWGIIDTWRRKKPEFWNTKKAYTPVKILQTKITDYVDGQSLIIPVYNRFNHTDLNELKFIYNYQESEVQISSPDLAPSKKGHLTIPLSSWNPGHDIVLSILDEKDRILDIYKFTRQENSNHVLPLTNSTRMIEIEDADKVISLKSESFNMKIDKSTGLIVYYDDESSLIQSGPYLNLRTKGSMLAYTVSEIEEHASTWKMTSMDYHPEHGKFLWYVNGTYNGMIPVRFANEISSDGVLKVEYSVEKIPENFIREIGIRFRLPDQFDSLSWSRDGYWSYYPEGELSGTDCKVALKSTKQNRYRENPVKEWPFDTKSFYYNGTTDENLDMELTSISRGAKENIYQYELISQSLGKPTVVYGNGDISCRISKMGNGLVLYVNNLTDYVDLSWGNYQRNIKISDSFSGEVTLRMSIK